MIQDIQVAFQNEINETSLDVLEPVFLSLFPQNAFWVHIGNIGTSYTHSKRISKIQVPSLPADP